MNVIFNGCDYREAAGLLPLLPPKVFQRSANVASLDHFRPPVSRKKGLIGGIAETAIDETDHAAIGRIP